MLCCAVLSSAVLCCPVLCCAILYYTILYYTILYYTILYYTILYYTILYYTILYYTILYYTILIRWIPLNFGKSDNISSIILNTNSRDIRWFLHVKGKQYKPLMLSLVSAWTICWHKQSRSLWFGMPSRAQIKESIKSSRHWPLCGEFTGERWIPRTKGQ